MRSLRWFTAGMIVGAAARDLLAELRAFLVGMSIAEETGTNGTEGRASGDAIEAR